MKKLTGLDWSQDWCNTGELGIEIAGIRSTGDLRLERRLDSFVVDIVPVDISEERLAHDFLCISWSASKTLVGFSGEELL